MIRHSIKLAFRNLWKNRIYTLINIFGLVIGLITFTYIILWSKYELSYDKHYPKSNRVYRISVEINEPGGRKIHFARCSQNWINHIPDYFPEIESMTRFGLLRRTAIKLDDTRFYTDNAYYCDSTVFKVFGLEVNVGDPAFLLRDPGTMIISGNLLSKLPDHNIIGRDIELSGTQDTAFHKHEVNGIFNSLPKNSHFHPDVLIAFNNPNEYYGWAYYYVLLHKEVDINQLRNKTDVFMKKYVPEHQRKISKIHFQSVQDIHLHSHKDREIENNYSYQLVMTFLFIGFIVYLLAIFNFVNLNLSLNSNRLKGYIINRIVGAMKRDLFVQMLAESVLTILIAASVSVVFSFLFIQKSSPEFFQIRIHYLVGFLISVIILTSILVVIPSWIQLNSQKITTRSGLKIPERGTFNMFGLKRILVILQFSISIILIVSAIHIHRQNSFLMSNRLGTNSGPVLVIKGLNWIVKDRYFALKEQLLKSPYILDVTASSEEPSGRVRDAMDFDLSGFANEEKQLKLGVFVTDDNYLPFFNIPLVAGRNFSPYNKDQKKEDYILNETAVKYLGYESPDEVIGNDLKMKFPLDGIFHGGKVVGVTRDFNLSTMHHRIQPLAIFQKDIWFWNFIIKLDSASIQEGIQYTADSWNDLLPDYAFDYSFSDDLFLKAYEHEHNQASLSRILTLLAVILAVLGLFGLSSLMIEQRTKEIGIRKVNGASAGQIIVLLQRQFSIWVLLSFILGFPSAYLVMEKWGQRYAYNIPISIWIFLLAGIITVFLCLFTISWRSIQAARKNPVDTLRYE
ncbi:ABC transporter permease [Bacteroidota bacterium]